MSNGWYQLALASICPDIPGFVRPRMGLQSITQTRLKTAGYPSRTPYSTTLWEPSHLSEDMFTEWAKTYGDIYSLKMASGTAVVISSPKLLRECMDVNGGITSDRPDIHAAKLLWDDKELVLTRYGPMWKNMRRAAHDILSRDACMKHLPIQHAEAVKLMYDFLERPKQFYTHVYRYAASVVYSVVWGIHCPEFNDSFIQDYVATIGIADEIMRPGGIPPVDIFPVLKYIPERWAPWKTLCKQAHTMQRKPYLDLLGICIDRVKRGKRTDCFIEYLLDHQDQYSLDDELTAYLGGSLIQAGSYTTAVRAQAEIDGVVGTDRMPGLDDLENLPYLRAVINEVHRFRPIMPTAVPHASTVDVRVGEYLIPKGSMIFMNTWGINHNEEYFDNPDSFDPERYLRSQFGTKSGIDTTGFRNDFVFGAGRRICPGSLLASNSIALNAMYMVWAFDFTPTKNPDSGDLNPISLTPMTDGIVLVPQPFECEIHPRSTAKAELIRKEYAAAKDMFDIFEYRTSVDH
ncbi:unnamed protein product [Somion occarium]|uniref:Cytochrome P450 n=1 Tax=Somion occarium TaxID=3059160 RepID=A0ABP1CY31_9APHY